MSNKLLKVKPELTVFLTHKSSEFPNIKLEVAEGKYQEYQNDICIKTIEQKDYDFLYILQERRIYELQKQGYQYPPPPFLPKFDEEMRPMLPNINVEQHNLSRMAADYEDEQLWGYLDNDRLFVEVEHSDIVSLHDYMLNYCRDSKIPELQLSVRELNCCHVAELRRLFYLPVVEKLSYLSVTCGLDSIEMVAEVLEESDALSVPLLLWVSNEIADFVPRNKNGSLMKNANLRELYVSIESIGYFTFDLKSLRDLHLLNPQRYDSAESEHDDIFKKLNQCEFTELKSLSIENVTAANYLKKLLTLPVIQQIERLSFSRLEYGNFPHETFLELSDVWQHIPKIFMYAGNKQEEIKELYKKYTQIVVS